MRLKKSHVVSGVLALALLGATGTAWYFALQARTPAQRAEETAQPEDSVITVRVDQDQLIDTLDFDAELNRTGDFEIPAPTEAPEGASAALASKIPLEVGDEVKAGTVLLEVSGRPMIALEGDVPAYRDLQEGDTGPDVEQLQLALQQLYGTPKTGTFDARTASDVKKLYDNIGYDHPTTSEEVVDENAEGEGDTPPDGEGEGDQDAENTGGGQTSTVERVTVPAAEVVFLPELPMQVSKINAQQSAPVTGIEGPLMVLASGDWKLEAKLDEETASALMDAGGDAELEFGSGPMEGQEVGAFELEEREEAAESDEGMYPGEEGEEQTEDVVYAVFEFDASSVEGIDDLSPGEEQEVTLIRARSAEDALIIPLSALWTDSEDRTMLTVVDDEGKERHVEVSVALRHEGRGVIEIVDGELAAGDEVVIAWRDRENA
jgi:peptidoglycan hydrolase-like protein with peptidoglycan-binding domain